MSKKRKNKKEIMRLDDPFLKEVILNTADKAKALKEKVESVPQTYIEDTFELGIDSNEAVVITNEVKKKSKVIMEEGKLIDSFSFKNKLNKLKVRIEYEKSFDFLFDYSESTKLYRSYHTNEIDDEYDLLLLKTVMTFTQKLAKMQINYDVYKKFEIYFDNLKFLYGKFKRADNTEKPTLNLELQKMKDMSAEISYHFFK